jgi:hypothetical protein
MAEEMSEPDYTIPDLMDALLIASSRVKEEIEQSDCFKKLGTDATVEELSERDLPDHADLEIPDMGDELRAFQKLDFKLRLYRDIHQLRRSVERYQEIMTRFAEADEIGDGPGGGVN